MPVPRGAIVELLEVTSDAIGRIEVPACWDSLVAVTTDGLALKGDDTGSRIIYVAVSEDRVLIGLEMSVLLDGLRTRGVRPSISAESLSFFLHDGQVPFPRTLYDGVFALTIGDRGRVKAEGDSLEVTFSLEFPYFSALSREDQEPDANRLLAVLAQATEEMLAGEENALLLLSAGKDSTALALALAEAGRTDVTCVTYAGVGDDEYVFAARRTCESAI